MFEMALREAIEGAQVRLAEARRGGRPYEEAAQAARLLDLIDRARKHGIDAADWVPEEVLATALATAGESP
jgi:hypothetical protein